jgi:hypothetical protein
MDDLYTVNDKLTTEWTDRLNLIRETVVRAEDALATQQLAKARKFYVRVALLNRECVTQRMILTNSRGNLVTSLKSLNQMIKQNAQLRGESSYKAKICIFSWRRCERVRKRVSSSGFNGKFLCS